MLKNKKMKINIPSFLFVMIMLIAFGCQKQFEKNSIAESGISANKLMDLEQRTPDEHLLLGEWSRTDSIGILKITALFNTPKLKAGYFNPKAMNVGKANWTKTGTLLSVFVEFRDNECPGCSYKLNYNPQRDMLVGEYSKASNGFTLPVEFARKK